MLPAAHRMRSSQDFRRTVRGGVRSGRSTVVVYAQRGTSPDREHSADPDPAEAADETTPTPTRVGFVVSKAVGNAVTRNRVKRRLRHLSRPLVEATDPGLLFVIRALPPAATAGDQLGADLGASWDRVVERLSSGSRR